MQRTQELLLIDVHFMTCSACILIKLTTTSPGVVPPTMGWALLNQPLRKFPTVLATALSYGSIFLIEVLSP